jgi:hypothetical protein
MIVTVLAAVALLLAVVPALLFLSNLRHYQPPSPVTDSPLLPVSVLIPARDEERSIGTAIESVLANSGVELEVVVLDDNSQDRTAEIVRAWMSRDKRVRLIEGRPLPVGWCGKQHACQILADHATFDVLLFIDADVVLQPDGIARLLVFAKQRDADLVSGVPRQITDTLAEKLLIPLIHFVLLGFLPINRMRASCNPAYAAGCGQLFLARREAYEAAGGHAAIRASLHDGITLPRAFRLAGRKTDLCDATDIAVCRMYRGVGEVWRGLAKNAHEGLGSPRLIVPASVLLLGGQVMPSVLVLAALWISTTVIALAVAAVVASYAPRLIAAVWFRQSWMGALLHPLGVTLLVTIQWYALVRRLMGRPSQWKNRSYGPERFADAAVYAPGE